METVSTHLVPITASATQVSRELLPNKLALVRKFASRLLTLQIFWCLMSDPIGLQKIPSNAISVNPNSCYISWSSSSGLLFRLLCCCLLIFIHFSVICVTWPGNSPAGSSTKKSGNRLLVQQVYIYVCTQMNV